MARDWESWLQAAARPASATEEAKRDRTERRIREAIQASSELPLSVRVYVKGSYKTNTNVRQDADVDVCVERADFAYVDTMGRAVGMGPALRKVRLEADQADEVLGIADVDVTAIVAVHGASVPWGQVRAEGVTVVPARRVPNLLQASPPILGPEQVARLADRARVRFRSAA
jgi:hypothetical protein